MKGKLRISQCTSCHETAPAFKETRFLVVCKCGHREYKNGPGWADFPKIQLAADRLALDAAEILRAKKVNEKKLFYLAESLWEYMKITKEYGYRGKR